MKPGWSRRKSREVLRRRHCLLKCHFRIKIVFFFDDVVHFSFPPCVLTLMLSWFGFHRSGGIFIFDSSVDGTGLILN